MLVHSQLTHQMSYKSLLCFIITIAIGLCNGKPKYGARFQTLENNENVDNKQIKLLTQLDDFCDANEQTCQAIQMIVAADLVQLLERKQDYDARLEDEISNNAMYQRTRRHPEADMIRFRAMVQRRRAKLREKELISKFKIKTGRLG